MIHELLQIKFLGGFIYSCEIECNWINFGAISAVEEVLGKQIFVSDLPRTHSSKWKNIINAMSGSINSELIDASPWRRISSAIVFLRRKKILYRRTRRTIAARVIRM
jgi:hypothetical protein